MARNHGFTWDCGSGRVVSVDVSSVGRESLVYLSSWSLRVMSGSVEFTPKMAWDPEAVAAAVDEMRDESETWLVEWTDGTSRTTTLVGVAWYARVFDPEATVTPT
jgi:hypothetical protein